MKTFGVWGIVLAVLVSGQVYAATNDAQRAVGTVAAQSCYDDAIGYLSAGRQRDAEKLLDDACAAYPDNQRLLFLRGVLKRSRFSTGEAFDWFSRAYALGAETAEGKAAITSSMMDRGWGVESGFGTLRQLIEQNPDNLLLRWLFAIQCREHRMYSREAAEQYETILAQWNPGPVLVHQTYANILTESLNRPEDALEHRWLAAELEPKGWTYQGLANTLKTIGRHEESLEVYAKMVELSPNDGDYWRQWGTCLFSLERYPEAAEKFRTAFECDETDIASLLFQGRSLEMQGRLEDGFACYKTAVELDPKHKFAAIYAALSKLYGRGTEPDYDDAGKLAACLNPKMAFLPWVTLGMCIKSSENGDPPLVPERVAVLHSSLESLAEQGSIAAQLTLGRIYEYGVGTERDNQKAVQWYERAFEQGDAKAAARIGAIYEEGGNGVERNPEKAFRYYFSAAEAGDCYAMGQVGRRYLVGSGVEPDLEKAIEWYDRCGETAGCEGKPYRSLGAAFKDGRYGVPKDWKEAERWYRKGANSGDATCLRLIGNMYEEGSQDFPRHIEKAIATYKEVWAMGPRAHNGARALIDLYCECADSAYRDPQAAVELALDVVEKNPNSSVCLASLAKAYAYNGQFDKAAARQRDSGKREAANPFNFNRRSKDPILEYYIKGMLPSEAEAPPPDDLYTQGMNCWYGRGGAMKDWKKALELFEAALEEGDVRAYQWIGTIYRNGGHGVEQNHAKAVEIFETGYAAGDVECAGRLANLYFADYGSARNPELGLKWGQLAADEHDDLMSLYHLADYYGANRDPEKCDAQKALHYAGKLMSKNTTSGTYLAAAAAAYARAGEFEKAIAIQQGVVDSIESGGNQSALRHMRDRLELYKQGKAYPQQRAKSLYQQAREYYQGADKTKYDYGKAVELLKQSYEQEPGSRGGVSTRIGMLFDQGGYGLERDSAQTLEWYGKALEAGHHPIHGFLIRFYLSPENDDHRSVEQAQVHADAILNEASSHAGLLSSAACARAQAGQFDEAAAIMEKAIEQGRNEKWMKPSVMERMEQDMEKYRNGEKPYVYEGETGE